MKNSTLIAFLVGILSTGSASAGPFSIKMLADNDFAIFSGTSTSVDALLYQNDVSWTAQVGAVSTLTFNLASGQDTFYVLGMGGDEPNPGVFGQENISGEVNGVNMTSVAVSMSSNIVPSLTGYNASDVADGTYDVILADVQAAFSGLSWGAPVVDSSQTVIVAGGFGSGFIFDRATAHLFSFAAAEVNVPEPSTFLVLALGLAGLAFGTRRRKLSA